MGESRILNDDELSNVTGGAKGKNIIKIRCNGCKSNFYADINKNVIKCPICGKEFEAKG